MEEIKDARYWLTPIYDKTAQKTPLYYGLKREIENNGCITLNTETDTVKIYTPELAVIFTLKELPAQNMETQKETNLNGWEYLKTYVEAYKEGLQFFESEFAISPNTLYGSNTKQYVRDIHLNFFHVQHTGIKEGWGYVKKQYPVILTHKAVKEVGFYSGIVSKVEAMVKKYPKLFQNFEKCEHDLQTQPIKTDQQQPEKLISFDSPETIEMLFHELKGFFPGKDSELKKALNGEQLNELLFFPDNGNRFVEVFRRLNYNGKLLNNFTQIRDWICTNFSFQYTKGVIRRTERFKAETVYSVLKGKSEPKKKNRLLQECDWLPHKTKSQLENEKEKNILK